MKSLGPSSYKLGGPFLLARATGKLLRYAAASAALISIFGRLENQRCASARSISTRAPRFLAIKRPALISRYADDRLCPYRSQNLSSVKAPSCSAARLILSVTVFLLAVCYNKVCRDAPTYMGRKLLNFRLSFLSYRSDGVIPRRGSVVFGDDFCGLSNEGRK
jgi:hypothetical protein